VRHNIILASVYELPIGKGKQYLSDGLAGGSWQLDNQRPVELAHRHPLNVFMNVGDPNLLPDGNDRTAGSQRPDLVPGVSIIPSGRNSGNWVNPALLLHRPMIPQPERCSATGTLETESSVPPIFGRFDLSVEKAFIITERLSGQFGAQFFNIFNHTQLADPNNLVLDYGCTGLRQTWFAV